jgi:hypothetical protein
VVSDTEARVVAVVEHARWAQPSPEAEVIVEQVARSHAGYTLLPSTAAHTEAMFHGALQGSVRNDCGELYATLSAAPPAFGFGVAGAESSVRSVPLVAVSTGARARDAIIEVVKAASGVAVEPAIEAVYSIDLDGNGTPEVIVQATHPDLQTDFADYRPEYYSLIVVLPDQASARPVYAGYIKAKSGEGGFEVFSLDAVADVDSDGKLELLVRGRHNEGTQTLVYRYDGAVNEVFRTVGGKGLATAGRSDGFVKRGTCGPAAARGVVGDGGFDAWREPGSGHTGSLSDR